jgi:nitrate reductase NapE component
MRPTDELDIKLAANRVRSPRYPTIAEVLAHRERRRAILSARFLLAMFVIFLVAAPFVDGYGFMLLGAAIFFAGFVINCLVIGNSHNTGGSNADPF